MMQSRGMKFIVETHSDYLIDRICSDIRDGVSNVHKNFQILFFDRLGTENKIYPLEVDERGEILEQPSRYRDFFMREQERILGIGRV
jgi:predicted ATPase